MRKLAKQDLTPKVANRSNKVVFLRLVGWYPVIGLIVVLLPESIASESLLLTQCVESGKAWIPAIAKMGAISTFPTVTGLYLIIMWALFPFVFLKFWSQIPNYPVKPVPAKALIRQAAAIAVISVMMFSVLYWFPFTFEDEDISMMMGRSGASLYMITHSKLGFGMFIGGCFWTLLVMAAFFMLIIKYLINNSFRSDLND